MQNYFGPLTQCVSTDHSNVPRYYRFDAKDLAFYHRFLPTNSVEDPYLSRLSRPKSSLGCAFYCAGAAPKAAFFVILYQFWINRESSLKHAGAESLDQLESLLEVLRKHKAIKEKKRGIFYEKSKALLHFHEDPQGIFADIKLDRHTFSRFRVSTKQEQKNFASRVAEFLND